MIDTSLCTFLIFADLPSARARSAQLAAAMHCESSSTKYWHPVFQLTDGTAALVVEPSGPFGTKPGPTALSQLTPNEIAALVPWATVQPLWPV